MRRRAPASVPRAEPAMVRGIQPRKYLLAAGNLLCKSTLLLGWARGLLKHSMRCVGLAGGSSGWLRRFRRVGGAVAGPPEECSQHEAAKAAKPTTEKEMHHCHQASSVWSRDLSESISTGGIRNRTNVVYRLLRCGSLSGTSRSRRHRAHGTAISKRLVSSLEGPRRSFRFRLSGNLKGLL
jgi:hypothetical protein